MNVYRKCRNTKSCCTGTDGRRYRPAISFVMQRMDCGLLYTEMVSAKAILYGNKNTEALMQVTPKEHPIALQLFGSDPEVMGEIAKRVEERPFDIIDVNMGCPVPKVVNNGEGSALMKNPVLVGKIVEAMAKAVENR